MQKIIEFLINLTFLNLYTGITPSGLDKFGFNVEGYDSRNCEYYFNGPHSLHYKEKV